MRRFVYIACAWLAASGGWLTAAEPSWDLSPYRVKLLVAIQGGALAPHAAGQLPADLATQAQRAMGAAWDIEAEAAPIQLRHPIATAIDTIAADQLPAAALRGDKVILLGLSLASGVTRLQARELDVATGLWNATLTRMVPQPDQTLAQSLRVVLAAFAPLARIDSVEGGVALLRLRGGGLGAGLAGSSTAGAVFRPVLMKSDGSGQIVPGSAEPIAWTWLTATSSSGSRVTCRIDTGLTGDAIPAYHPRRPRWALAVAPPEAPTQLRLVSQASTDKPLEGYDVLVQDAEPATLRLLGRTDGRGEVAVPPGAATVQMLLVRQEESVLARVPIVPGLLGEMVLPLPDSASRLQAQTLLAEAEDNLLDLAARREALSGRIRLASEAGQTSAADKLKSKLKKLTSGQALGSLLDEASQSLSADPQAQAALQPKLDALREQAKLLDLPPATEAKN